MSLAKELYLEAKEIIVDHFRTPTFWKVVFWAILVIGGFSIVYRFAFGLGAATNLSDEFPWGLWIGFDVMTGVGLAAGGFTISGLTYIFNIKKFKPIVKPAILTAMLGYILVVVGLLVDLGRPWYIWHMIIHWNIHSPLFEVGTCVLLYNIVLILEFSPVVFKKLRWSKAFHLVKRITMPLVILGVILSTLHQSSLGSLFLPVFTQMHPFWYSPLLPVLFYLSAVMTAFAMVTVESNIAARALRKQVEIGVLAVIARILVVLMVLFGVIRLIDLYHQGILPQIFQANEASLYFWIEYSLMIIIPLVLLTSEKRRWNNTILFYAAASTVVGFTIHRLNVAVTARTLVNGDLYSPSFMELMTSVFIVAVGMAAYGFISKYFDLHDESGFTTELDEAEKGHGGGSPQIQMAKK
jgi:Ni/Fe-hydrogenase subunit HybB-like protein